MPGDQACRGDGEIHSGTLPNEQARLYTINNLHPYFNGYFVTVKHCLVE